MWSRIYYVSSTDGFPSLSFGTSQEISCIFQTKRPALMIGGFPKEEGEGNPPIILSAGIGLQNGRGFFVSSTLGLDLRFFSFINR